jgi:hypothetical protein
VVTVSVNRFNFQMFHFLATQCIYVFGMDFRTYGDYFPIRHELIGFVSVYSAVQTGSLKIVYAVFSV